MPARKRARAEAPVETATLTDPDEHHPTFRQLATLWRAGQLCDVTFTVEGRSFSAHKLVLAAASAYVRALVDGPRFADSSSDALTLDEMPAAAFELLLEWIYSGSCNAPLNLLQPLLLAAGRLQVPALEMAAAMLSPSGSTRRTVPTSGRLPSERLSSTSQRQPRRLRSTTFKSWRCSFQAMTSL